MEALMKRSRQEKKDRLGAKADQLIERYLAWEEDHPQPNLTEIEDLILQLRKELGQEMAQLLLEEQAARAPVPGPACPHCGKEMRSKGQKGNTVESRVGQVDVERGYYYCPECGAGLFPPGSTT
jgi:hypothetical protein